MIPITTHVLDTARGAPAAGVSVRLDRLADDAWSEVGAAVTDKDGRARDFAGEAIPAGTYRLTFDTDRYFAAHSVDSFYPVVQVTFVLRDGSTPHHLPLLLSPYGYSTYRGS
ncbi:MAG: hydroxyisourate hydrolase [Gemmatimonadaceae bacterium]